MVVFPTCTRHSTSELIAREGCAPSLLSRRSDHHVGVLTPPIPQKLSLVLVFAADGMTNSRRSSFISELTRSPTGGTGTCTKPRAWA